MVRPFPLKLVNNASDVSLNRLSAASKRIGSGCVTFDVSSHVEGSFSIQN
jgi:hypothetical protein